MKFDRLYSGWVALALLVLAVACGKDPAQEGKAATETRATQLASQPQGSVNGLWEASPR